MVINKCKSTVKRWVLKRLKLQIADRLVDLCHQQDARMNFHICIVRYVFGMPALLLLRAPTYDQVIFVLNPIFTNPTLLHVKPVNAAASRASSLRLSLMITLAESVTFKRGELAVS